MIENDDVMPLVESFRSADGYEPNEAFQELCALFQSMILRRALRWYDRIQNDAGIDTQDLENVGRVGLWKAAIQFDGRGSFAGYAHQKIRAEIGNYLKGRVWRFRVPRPHGVEAAEFVAMHLNITCASLDWYQSYWDTIPGNVGLQVLDDFNGFENKQIVERLLNYLTPYQRQIVEGTMQDKSFREIGETLGLGRKIITNTYHRALKTITKCLLRDTVFSDSLQPSP